MEAEKYLVKELEEMGFIVKNVSRKSLEYGEKSQVYTFNVMAERAFGCSGIQKINREMLVFHDETGFSMLK